MTIENSPFGELAITKSGLNKMENTKLVRRTIILAILLISVQALLSTRAVAQSAISVSNDQALLKFPEWIAFSADLKSESEISRVILEYKDERQTCGDVVAKAFPTFTPAKEVKARWTWEMKQSGSEPPGAIVSWRWRITAADGKETVTDWHQVTWRDDWHPWQALMAGPITVRWYSGDRAFGSALLDAATRALKKWNASTSLTPDVPISIYVYGSAQDMRDAVFYEPAWTGGRAYSSQSIIMLGIAPSELDWGETSIMHEVTHILFGRYSFSCFDGPPLWLREGLAMYIEGPLDATSQAQWNAAVASDRLASVRALASNFPEASEQADLAYSESFSLVSFLIDKFGERKVIALIDDLREGTPIDDAMRSTFGFDVDGLEDAWRAKIGARPRPRRVSATPTATPTVVPTYAPVPGFDISMRAATLVPATAAVTAPPAAQTPLPTASPP